MSRSVWIRNDAARDGFHNDGTICFPLGRFPLRTAAAASASFEDGFRRDSFSYLLFLRLVPVFPFWLVNIVPALLGMKLGPYTAATLIGIIPAAFVYASVGASFGALFERGEAPDFGIIFEWRFLLPLLGLAALALVPVLYTHLRGGNDSARS